jgi:hypothetical protein
MFILTFLKGNIKTISILILMFLCSYLGYKYNDYKRDSEYSAAKEAAEFVIRAEQNRESEIAKIMNKKLEQLNANERIIERERIKLVDRPIYNVECIDDEGLELIKKYAQGISKSTPEDK